jgi:hypothetical protein
VWYHHCSIGFPIIYSAFSSRAQGPSLQYVALLLSCENSDNNDLVLSTCLQQVTGPGSSAPEVGGLFTSSETQLLVQTYA